MISSRAINCLKYCCRNTVIGKEFFNNVNSESKLLFSSIYTLSLNFGRRPAHSEASPGKTTKYRVDEDFGDTFGNIGSLDLQFDRIKDDPEDIKEYKRDKAAKGVDLYTYLKEIKHLLRKNDYKAAINVLEVDMVNDRIPVNTYAYKLFLAYNAKIGNLEEAYRLYTNFKKRNGKLDGGMYTSLFNACGNCPNSQVALEKANAIWKYMENDKDHEINVSNYNAMLKAFGRHCDLLTCLKIVDIVLEKKNIVDDSTYCFLLQACISDKNSGLRHALMAWRKMLQNKCVPSIYSFNNMLRCVRDCHLGDIKLIDDLVKQIQEGPTMVLGKKVQFTNFYGVKKKKIVNYLKLKNNAEKKQIAASGINEIQPDESEKVHLDITHSVSEAENNPESFIDALHEESKSALVQPIFQINNEVPNLLSLTPTVGSVVKFGSMTKPHERFLLLGGLKGFMKTMTEEFEVKPDLKTFTLLLDLVPGTSEAEDEVIREAKYHDIKLDTAFFNVLIKRRACRNEPCALEVSLRQMALERVSPDILTFGVMALACTTEEKGIDLIESARKAGIRLNAEILGALMKRAKQAGDMQYVKTILKAAKEDEATLSVKFLSYLEDFVRSEQRKRKGKQHQQHQESNIQSS